jgi:hypothetical protein
MTFSSGNVGIGSTAPNAPLDVASATTSSSAIQQWSYSSNPSNYRLQLNTIVSSGLVKYSFDLLNAGVSYNNTLVLTNGLIGIGTTSPSNKLHVIGNAWINRPSNKIDNNGSPTEFGSRVEFNNDFATSASGYMVFRYPTSNNFLIGGDYDGHIGGAIPNIQFGRANGTVYLHIDASTSGNVGIGTTSPSAKLHVEGNATPGNYAAYIYNSSGGGNVLKLYNHDWDVTDYLLYATNGGTASSGFAFVVDGNGKVGIGTTTPNRTLSVNGIIGVASGTANTQQLVFSIDSGASYITSSYFGSSSYVPMYLETGGAIRLAIQTNGNIGIGTTTDAGYKLYVNGTGLFNGVVNSPAIMDNVGRRFISPEGATYVTGSSSITGAIKIKLPVARNNSSTMMMFRVKIYQYNTGNSFELQIGGYNYGLGDWYNVFATNLTDDGSNLSVRFGTDATSDCVWIGELGSTWSYPQVFVTDFQAGYGGQDIAWATGWAISFETAFNTVELTRLASQVITTRNIGSQSVSYATTAGALTSMLISQFTNDSGYITSGALAGYLPLAGGTLTGNLNGTTASFSGQVTSTTNFYTAAISDTLGARTFGGNSFSIRNNTAEDFNIDIYNRNSSIWYNALKLANNGGAASFSSSITSGATGLSNGSFTIKRASDGLSVAGFSIDTSTSIAKLTTEYSLLSFATEGVERARFLQGKLGIGTTSPSQLLSIEGGASNAWARFTNTTNSGGLYVGTSSTGEAILYQAGNYNLSLFTNATERLTITNTGAATFSSSVTASSIIKSGGTSAQFLKADGSVDSNTYITSASLAGYALVDHTHDLGRYSLAAPGNIDGLTSTTFRTTLFGVNTNTWNISTARWNNVPAPLSGLNLYSTMLAWSGSDTHGFIAMDYGSAAAKIGGGNGNNINWTALLVHSLNIGSQSVLYATTAGALTSMNISQFTNNSGYITSASLSGYLPLTGGTLTGDLTTSGWFINSTDTYGIKNSANNSSFWSQSGGWVVNSNDTTSVTLAFYTQYTQQFAIGRVSEGIYIENNQGAEFSLLAYQGAGYGGYLTGTWNVTNILTVAGNYAKINKDYVYDSGYIEYYSSFATTPSTKPWRAGVFSSGDVEIGTIFQIKFPNSTATQFQVFEYGQVAIGGSWLYINEGGTSNACNINFGGGTIGATNSWKIRTGSGFGGYNLLNNATTLYNVSTSGTHSFYSSTPTLLAQFSSTAATFSTTIVATNGDILGGSTTSDYGSLTLRGGYGTTAANAAKIQIIGYEDGAATQGALMFFTNNTERFRISQTGAAVFFGSVGVTSNYLSVGAYGLASDTYSAYFRRNDTSSYGAWDLTGGKGGYTGALYNTTNQPHVMFGTTNGHGGLYYQNGSRWVLYYDYTNNCLGVGGTTTSATYKLYVTGAIFATGAIVANSDSRIKENVEVVGNALDKVNNLRGVTYTKKNEDTGKREMGVIAQEVLPYVPEVVQYAEDLDQYGVSYGNFAGLFIEAIKEQQVLIKELQAEIEILKNK